MVALVKTSIFAFVAALSTVGNMLPAAADPVESYERCYQLSLDGEYWSRTPETLCVLRRVRSPATVITLKSGMPMKETIVATMHLTFLKGDSCVDCNENLYGVFAPGNSVFNSLRVEFKGVRDRANSFFETGTVKIGGTQYFYRDLF